VVGGLICATVATLMFVPVVFSIFHERRGEVTALPIGEPRVI
jgi:Cu/Ag efflux pump CusA